MNGADVPIEGVELGRVVRPSLALYVVHDKRKLEGARLHEMLARLAAASIVHIKLSHPHRDSN